MEHNQLQAACDTYIKQNQLRGLQVCVQAPGEPVFSYVYGSTAQQGSPIDRNTLFSIGSLSKLITTAVVLLLEQQNLLTLKTPVFQLLPQFKMSDGRYKRITVEMLLSHTSGLPSTVTMGKYTNEPNRQFLRDFMEAMRTDWLKDDPGLFGSYCNDGYALAELIVEAVTHQSYSQTVQEMILEPLEMKHTNFPVHELREGHFIHAPSAFDLDSPQEYVNGIASGGIYSTAVDINRFLQGLPELLGETAWQRMQQPIAENFKVADNTASRYGLGWDNVRMPQLEAQGLVALAKNGATFGFTAQAVWIPERQLSVVTMQCSCQGKAADLNTILAEMAAPGEPEISERVRQVLGQTDPVAISGLYANNQIQCWLQATADRLLVKLRQGEESVELQRQADGYHSEQVVLGFAQPTITFMGVQKNRYAVLEYTDPVSPKIRQQMVWLQQLKATTAPTRWQTLRGRQWILEQEYFTQRKLKTPVLLEVDIQPEYPNILFQPYPLQMISDVQAKPFLQIPGELGCEMTSLLLQPDGSLRSGQYRYRPVKDLPVLELTELQLRNEVIAWFRGGRAIDTMRLEGNIRCVMVDKGGNVIFDSVTASRLPESLNDCMIGFFGHLNAKASVQYLEDENERID